MHFLKWVVPLIVCGFLHAAQVRVVYTANRQGDVAPCDCEVNQIGGIARFAEWLRKQRHASKSPLLVFDSGDTFFSALNIFPPEKEMESLRAQAIADSYRLMGVTAVAVGEGDFAQGLSFLQALQRRSGAKFLSANLLDEKGHLLFEPYHLFKTEEGTVAAIGLSSPEVMAGVKAVRVTSPLEALKKYLPEMETAKPRAIFVLSHLGMTQDREIAKVKEGLFILGAHSLDALTKPVEVNQSWIVQPLYRGEQVGLITFDTRDTTKRSHVLVSLDSQFEKQNDVSRRVKQFEQEVKQRAVAEAQEKGHLDLARPFVAHPSTCRKCHEAQYDFWAKTKHAAAYLTLYAKDEHFDPECIGCHTLGFGDPRGFQKAALPIELVARSHSHTPFVESLMKDVFQKSLGPLDSRKDPKRFQLLHDRYLAEVDRLDRESRFRRIFLGVQCEHCHGNRNGHPYKQVESPKVTEVTCRKCHRAPNAPDFKPDMIAKVSCPRMVR